MIGIGTGVLVVVLLLVLFIGGGDEFDWEEEYKYNEEQPFDNNLIYDLLEARAMQDSFYAIKKSLAKEFKPTDIEGTASYVYIGEKTFYSDNDLDSLLLFTEMGHDVFISSNYIDQELTETLGLSNCLDSTLYDEEYDDELDTTYVYYDYYTPAVTSYFTDSIGSLNLMHPTLIMKEPLRYVFKPNYKLEKYEWRYFNISNWCGGEQMVAKLGSNSVYINFIKVEYGEGAFYLHTNPLVFTNYYLLQEDKLGYAQNVFSHLPDGSIYWDEGSRYFHYEDMAKSKSKPFGKSELKYILSQPASKWAFYTMLSGILLYILFFMKRRQRIIPVIEPYANTSVEYVQTIGGLYFIKKDHRRLAEQKFRLFLSFIRNRYKLSTQHLDGKLRKQLANTSKIEEDKINRIFDLYGTIAEKSAMSEEQLISFNKHLEYFYQNCK